MFNFYQINGDGEIRTRDRLVIKALIPCQIIISTQKLKLLGKVLGYDLYYSLSDNEYSDWIFNIYILFIIYYIKNLDIYKIFIGFEYPYKYYYPLFFLI
jgi:hypothetical protein